MRTNDPGDAARIKLHLTELRLPATKPVWAALAAQADKEGWLAFSRSRIAPRRSGSRGLAVDLIGHRAMDHVDVLLAQDDVCFPGREQLRLGRPGYHKPGGNGDDDLE